MQLLNALNIEAITDAGVVEVEVELQNISDELSKKIKSYRRLIDKEHKKLSKKLGEQAKELMRKTHGVGKHFSVKTDVYLRHFMDGSSDDIHVRAICQHKAARGDLIFEFTLSPDKEDLKVRKTVQDLEDELSNLESAKKEVDAKKCRLPLIKRQVQAELVKRLMKESKEGQAMAEELQRVMPEVFAKATALPSHIHALLDKAEK